MTAKTNAERQREYRMRKAGTTKTINIQLSTEAKSQLDTLTAHYQLTQRETIEMMINTRYNTIKSKVKKCMN